MYSMNFMTAYPRPSWPGSTHSCPVEKCRRPVRCPEALVFLTSCPRPGHGITALATPRSSCSGLSRASTSWSDCVCGNADKNCSNDVCVAGKLVDGRPPPTMTVERTRLVAINRTPVGLARASTSYRTTGRGDFDVTSLRSKKTRGWSAFSPGQARGDHGGGESEACQLPCSCGSTWMAGTAPGHDARGRSRAVASRCLSSRHARAWPEHPRLGVPPERARFGGCGGSRRSTWMAGTDPRIKSGDGHDGKERRAVAVYNRPAMQPRVGRNSGSSSEAGR